MIKCLQNSRSFPIPCTAERTNGDYASPFTCGSEPRRAIIKYFVRNYAGTVGNIPGECGTSDVNRTVQDKNKEVLMNVIHKRLTDLYNKWSDYSNFACERMDPATGLGTGVHGVQFCDPKDSSSWVPEIIRNWDTATSAQVIFYTKFIQGFSPKSTYLYPWLKLVPGLHAWHVICTEVQVPQW